MACGDRMKRAGLITEDAAKARRKKIEAEADFYGAMDGASKFVRGDAVAGILIMVINIIGGLLIGTMMHGLPLADATKTYTLLTIGDGLVAQIPGLLLSIVIAVVALKRAKDEGVEIPKMPQGVSMSRSEGTAAAPTPPPPAAPPEPAPPAEEAEPGSTQA
jgi:flagellar biosynthesis protein FlhA